MKQFVVAAAVVAVAVCGMAVDRVDAIFMSLEKAPWGARAPEVRRHVGTPLFQDKTILVTRSDLYGEDATLNHLFGKNGKLYNVSWYIVVPVTDMSRAQRLWREMQASLRGRLRGPKHSEIQGDVDGADAVLGASPELRRTRETIAAMMAGEEKPDIAALKEAMGGFDLREAVPHLFYSEMHYWDTRSLRVYAALFCSTDGNIYIHLNFVSKRQTARELYPTGNRVPFSYTPLDRDQDAITKANHEFFNQ